MGKPKGGKDPKGGKGKARGKGKFSAQNVYTAEERSQAYLVNAERVASGLAPASIASICRSRRRSAARHAELHLSELARREEPTVPRPPPPEPPAPRRRVPPQESGDERAEASNAVPGTPPEAFGPPEEGSRSGRSAEPSTPDVVLRSVSRSASPSDRQGNVRLRSRSPTMHSPGHDMARAVRGEAAPSRPAPPVLLGSPDQESSSEDAITKAVRGDAAPSRLLRHRILAIWRWIVTHHQ